LKVNVLLKKLVRASKFGKLLFTSTPESVDDFLIQEKNYLFVFTTTKQQIPISRVSGPFKSSLKPKNPLKTSAYEHASTEDHEEYNES